MCFSFQRVLRKSWTRLKKWPRRGKSLKKRARLRRRSCFSWTRQDYPVTKFCRELPTLSKCSREHCSNLYCLCGAASAIYQACFFGHFSRNSRKINSRDPKTQSVWKNSSKKGRKLQNPPTLIDWLTSSNMKKNSIEFTNDKLIEFWDLNVLK